MAATAGGVFVVLATFICFGVIEYHCLVVVPERGRVERWDPQYLDFANLSVSRAGRRSRYLIHIEGRTRHVWANNVTLKLMFYEYLHNEYRRNFLEFTYRLCDLVNEEPYIGAMLRRVVTCPLPAAHHRLANMSVPTQNFPGAWPFQRGRVRGVLTVAPKSTVMVEAYIDLKFENENKKN